MMNATLFDLTVQAERKVQERANERRRILHELEFDATRRPSMVRRAIGAMRRSSVDGEKA